MNSPPTDFHLPAIIAFPPGFFSIEECRRVPAHLARHSNLKRPRMTGTYDEIYAMVCRIPEGHVATYGQIARLTNRPRGARQVGYALAALSDDRQVPWHRVVNAQGEISWRAKGGYEEYQRILLESEGVLFDESGRIDLSKFLWCESV